MDIISALILGLVQAFTEFLPISSSGHLVVFQVLLRFKGFRLPESTLAFDIVIHFATLLVTLLYLRKELKFYFVSCLSSRKKCIEFLIPFSLGFIPAGIAGGLVLLYFKEVFDSVTFVAYGFFLTAIILELSHRKSLKSTDSEFAQTGEISLPTPRQALIVGLAQAVAVLPGVSRSGSTVGLGLLVGLSKEVALKFSFLISIPIIVAANLVKLPELFSISSSEALSYLVGFTVSLFFGLLAIKLLEIFVRGSKLRYFAIYVFCLGAFLQLF